MIKRFFLQGNFLDTKAKFIYFLFFKIAVIELYIFT